MTDSILPEDIAKSWIAMHYAETDSNEYQENFWAYRVLEGLRSEDPERCFSVVKEIIRIDSSDRILANLAAGPVEDLLVTYGSQLADRLVGLAKSDVVWKKILGAVWRNDIEELVWKKIVAVAGPSW